MRTGRNLQCQTALSFRFRSNQISQTFGDGEIHLTVGKSPARKLPGFRDATVKEATELLKQLFNNSDTAMKMELRAVFTGKAARTGKEQCQPTVDGSSIPCAERLVSSITWLDHLANNRFDYESNLRT
ncbi:hypothetical protein FQZ97_1109430 [compost metagenome]